MLEAAALAEGLALAAEEAVGARWVGDTVLEPRPLALGQALLQALPEAAGLAEGLAERHREAVEVPVDCRWSEALLRAEGLPLALLQALPLPPPRPTPGEALAPPLLLPLPLPLLLPLLLGVEEAVGG